LSFDRNNLKLDFQVQLVFKMSLRSSTNKTGCCIFVCREIFLQSTRDIYVQVNNNIFSCIQLTASHREQTYICGAVSHLTFCFFWGGVSVVVVYFINNREPFSFLALYMGILQSCSPRDCGLGLETARDRFFAVLVLVSALPVLVLASVSKCRS